MTSLTGIGISVRIVKIWFKSKLDSIVQRIDLIFNLKERL